MTSGGAPARYLFWHSLEGTSMGQPGAAGR
jgi:hypothetical protein